jgi:hypothetical protein
MKFKNYIETESGIKDTSTSPGTAGQVLSSTVAGTSWIDQGEIIAAAATLVTIECKNTHTTPLTKGTPVYQTGTVGATDVIEIAPGSALVSSGAQPSIGLLQQDLAINEFTKHNNRSYRWINTCDWAESICKVRRWLNINKTYYRAQLNSKHGTSW